MLKEGMILAERYEIISKVGTGGMADVYKARDHKLNRLVAVKVLKPEFRDDKTFIAKFQKEAQAAAGLAHPNIVNVYDVGDDEGVNFIVMELVEGITLKDYIKKKGKLSVKEATSIAIQVSPRSGSRSQQKYRSPRCETAEHYHIDGRQGKAFGFRNCQSRYVQYHNLQCDGFRSLQFSGTGEGRIQ